MAETPRPNTPQVDLRVWEVVEQLGVGGQAATYKVRNKNTGEIAAAKILHPWKEQDGKAKSEEDQRARFKKEVQNLIALNELRCPRIVQVKEADLLPNSGNQPWYIMPLYEGGAMAQIDDKGKVEKWAEDYKCNTDRVLVIVERLAQTLAFVHKEHGLHRDVHVGNVFFETPGSDPILGDFGLSHLEGIDGGFHTEGTEEFGPWRWRPPQLTGGSGESRNPKSDIYLLGGLLYDVLSGGKYIPAPLEVRFGEFKHELPEYDLSTLCDDHRMGSINRLLRHTFATSAEMRLSAEDIADAVSKIRSESKGKPVALPAPSELTAAVERFKATNKGIRARPVREELRLVCTLIAGDIGVNESGERDKVYTQITPNVGDGMPQNSIEKHYPDAVWAAVRIKVDFESTVRILRFSYFSLIRTHDGKEVVGYSYQEGSGGQHKFRELRRSYPSDPANAELIRRKVREEYPRMLSEMAGLIRDQCK